MTVASGETTGWDWALTGVGLTLIAILLVMGTVAWVRDGCAERSSTRSAAKLVEQELRHARDAEWARRHP